MEKYSINAENFLFNTKSGIPVHNAPSNPFTASIWVSAEPHIIVGENFFLLNCEEKEFILLHEEGHLKYGPIPDEGSFQEQLHVESNCDLFALKRSNLNAALGAMDKMISNTIRLNFSTKLLDERKKILEKHVF